MQGKGQMGPTIEWEAGGQKMRETQLHGHTVSLHPPLSNKDGSTYYYPTTIDATWHVVHVPFFTLSYFVQFYQ